MYSNFRCLAAAGVDSWGWDVFALREASAGRELQAPSPPRNQRAGPGRVTLKRGGGGRDGGKRERGERKSGRERREAAGGRDLVMRPRRAKAGARARVCVRARAARGRAGTKREEGAR